MIGTPAEAGPDRGAGREVGAEGETPGRVPGAGGQLLPPLFTI